MSAGESRDDKTNVSSNQASIGADFCFWLWMQGLTLRARPSWVQGEAPGRGSVDQIPAVVSPPEAEGFRANISPYFALQDSL